MPKIKSALKSGPPASAHVLSKKHAKPHGKAKAGTSNGVSFEHPAAEKAKGSASAKAKGKGKQDDKPGARSTEESVKQETKASRKPQVVDPIATTSTFLIVVGSYEKNLYGIEGTFGASTASSSGPRAPRLRPIFIFPAHISCIKAVAASPSGGKWLATGSDDEIVKIWDLRRRKEVGGLSQHVGSITSLTFPTRSHLLSASDDSTISLFRTSDWALLRSLKGHSGRINHLAVHPSGRVALSVGKDRTLKMWDLMRGRGAASLALGTEATVVRFSRDGSRFAVLSDEGVDVYALDMKRVAKIVYPKRLLDVEFGVVQNTDGVPERELILVGAEDGKTMCYELERVGEGEASAAKVDGDEGADDEADDVEVKTLEAIAVFGGHTNRVKAISVLRLRIPGDDATAEALPITTIFTTVSSDGKINVHDLAAALVASASDATEPILPIATYDTKGSRLVCVTIAESMGKNKPVVREAADGDYEYDEGEGEGDDDLYGDVKMEDEDEQEFEAELEAEDDE